MYFNHKKKAEINIYQNNFNDKRKEESNFFNVHPNDEIFSVISLFFLSFDVAKVSPS